MSAELRAISPRVNVPAPLADRQALTLQQREKLAELLVQIKPVLTAQRAGASRAALVRLYMAATGSSRPTAYRDVDHVISGNLEGLAPRHNGKGRTVTGAEALIVQYYQRPGQPTAGDIAFWLMQDHDISLKKAWISRYLKSLPSNATITSRKRIGAHFYEQNIRPHVRRDWSDVRPGEFWVSDGHRVKVICWHPTTGDLFRAEVTPILDQATNYCYGFWVAANESALDTVYALCSTMARYDHVPTFFQTDPGPGFLNKRVQGLLIEAGIEHLPTRGGNARGKGFGESFFRILISRFAKQYDTFTGDDRTDDALARMRTKVKKGELNPPFFEQLKGDLETFRNAYNAWPQADSEKLKGKSPNEAMEGWIRNPLHLRPESLLRPFGRATVSHHEIRFENRFYRHADLARYEKRKVIYQYDEHDHSHCWVLDSKHRLICIAPLVGTARAVKANILEDRREKSRVSANGRLQKRIAENDARHLPLLTGSSIIDALTLDVTPALPAPTPAQLMLEQGHSFNIPTTAPAVRVTPLRAIDPSIEQHVTEAIAAEQQLIPVDAHARWALYQRVLSGVETDAEIIAWAGVYAEHPECRGFSLTLNFDAFEPAGNSASSPSLSRLFDDGFTQREFPEC